MDTLTCKTEVRTVSKTRKALYQTADKIIQTLGGGEMSHMMNPFAYSRTYPRDLKDSE